MCQITVFLRRYEIAIVGALLLIVGIARFSIYLASETIGVSSVMVGDSADYDGCARSILTKGYFARFPERPYKPEWSRTPGYPLFIAFMYWVGAVHYAPLIFVQVCMSILTLWGVYFFSRYFFGIFVGYGALLLALFDIPSHIFSVHMTTETLFTLLMMGVYFFGSYILVKNKHQLSGGFLTGFLLACATLVRPISYFLVYILPFLFIVFGYLKHWPRKMIAGVFACMIVPGFILVGGWQLRNYCVVGTFEFSSIKNFSIVYSKIVDMVQRREHINYQDATQRVIAMVPDRPQLPSIEENRRYGKFIRDFIPRHPVLFFQSSLYALVKLLFIPGEYGFLYHMGVPYKGTDAYTKGPMGDLVRLSPSAYIQKWVKTYPGRFTVSLVAMGGVIALYLGCILALWNIIFYDRARWDMHLFLMLVVSYLIVATISVSMSSGPRFRIPLMPVFLAYSAWGWCGVGRFIRQVSAMIKKTHFD